MRIAIGGISSENSNFSSMLTYLADFSVWSDQALLTSGRYPFLGEFNVEFIPTLFAGSLPGGPIEASAYRTLKEGILSRLQAAGPLDGVYLDLHGAMLVEGLEDAEADLASAVRAVVGPQALIGASMDLHGNLTHEYVAQINLLTAYRTAPHRDTVETRQRACRLLVDAISKQIRPHVTLIPIPLLYSGEQTRTEIEPGKSLWAALDRLSQPPGVLDASLFVGFAWVDERRAHAAAVVSGTDASAMQRTARQIAQSYWDARSEFGFGVQAGSIDECIQWALANPAACVFMSDSGDNLTAGAPGDIPLVLERLLAHNVPSAVVGGIADAQAARQCAQAGVGATVAVELGGKLDTLHGKPLPVRGVVQRVIEMANGEGVQVVLRVANVDVIITEQRKAFTTIANFTQAGVNPLDYKIVVVKLGYLFPDLVRVAPAVCMALSPGVSDLALERLPYQRIVRPMYPLDKEMVWEAA